MNVNKKILTIALASLSFLPMLASATIVTCNGIDCDFNSFIALINGVINFALAMSGFIAAGTCIYAGTIILFHPAEPGKRSDAYAMFTKAIKGLAIVLLSWLVIHTLVVWLVNPSFDALRFFNN